jgi:phosphotransferase system enzyme I (PtsP)
MEKHDEQRFNLLCDLSSLSDLLAESSDIENFLQRTAKMVAHRMEADVCSIYLFDENANVLVLRATVGLNPDAVGKIRMKPGEGLVGATFERLQAIREASASLNPKFKYFEEADEEGFESFLSVPIQRGVQRIGVLTVQHKKRNFFTERDVMALKASASQLAGAIENVRLLIGLRYSDTVVKDSFDSPQFIKGESASRGYAFAPAIAFQKSHALLLSADSDVKNTYTLHDLQRAVRQTADQLKSFQQRVAERLPESASLIFTAHFMILKDAQFVGRMIKHIDNGISVPDAIKAAAKHYIDLFSASPHAYIREKTSDMADLAGRILKNLYEHSSEESSVGESRIVVARELYPSEILKLASEEVKGIILVRGGVTSHVSILARSLQIPMVIADRPDLLNLPDGTPVLLDADIGNIYVRPSQRIIRQFEEGQTARQTADLAKKVMSPFTQTGDGTRIRLLANINLLSELPLAQELNAEGIGLYRTEFPFLVRPNFPSEEEQYLIYKRLFEEMKDRPVTIRTLDISGDKALVYSNAMSGANPDLGLRSIRFSLRHRDIFEQQIRAILRAAAQTSYVRILFPMISSIDEFRDAKSVVSDCLNALERENTEHCSTPQIGIMAELPAIVEIAREIAHEADFISIGTNDFIQYMIAVDRSNEKVADYYRSYHPSVLRGLAKIVSAANAENTDITVCGEMAHEAEYIPFLIGIGVRNFSLDPKHLPFMQQKIASISLAQAEAYAKDLLSESTLKGTLNILQQQLF